MFIAILPLGSFISSIEVFADPNNSKNVVPRSGSLNAGQTQPELSSDLIKALNDKQKSHAFKIKGKVYTVEHATSKVGGQYVRKDFLIGPEFREILLSFSSTPRLTERIIVKGMETFEFKRPWKGKFRNLYYQKHSKLGVLTAFYVFDDLQSKYTLVNSKVNSSSEYHLDLEVGTSADYSKVDQDKTLEAATAANWLGEKTSDVKCHIEQADRVIFDPSCLEGIWAESKPFMIQGLADILSSENTQPKDANDTSTRYLSCLEQHHLAPTAAKFRALLYQVHENALSVNSHYEISAKDTSSPHACQESPDLGTVAMSNYYTSELLRHDEPFKPIINCTYMSTSQGLNQKGVWSPGNQFVSIGQDWRMIGSWSADPNSKIKQPISQITEQQKEDIRKGFGNVEFHELLHMVGITDDNWSEKIDQCCAYRPSEGGRKKSCSDLDDLVIYQRKHNAFEAFLCDSHVSGNSSSVQLGECGAMKVYLDGNTGHGTSHAEQQTQNMFDNMADWVADQTYDKSIKNMLACLTSEKPAPPAGPLSAEQQRYQLDCYQKSQQVFLKGLQDWAEYECTRDNQNPVNLRNLRCDPNKDDYFVKNMMDIFKRRFSEDYAQATDIITHLKKDETFFIALLNRTNSYAATGVEEIANKVNGFSEVDTTLLFNAGQPVMTGDKALRENRIHDAQQLIAGTTIDAKPASDYTVVAQAPATGPSVAGSSSEQPKNIAQSNDHHIDNSTDPSGSSSGSGSGFASNNDPLKNAGFSSLPAVSGPPPSFLPSKAKEGETLFKPENVIMSPLINDSATVVSKVPPIIQIPITNVPPSVSPGFAVNNPINTNPASAVPPAISGQLAAAPLSGPRSPASSSSSLELLKSSESSQETLNIMKSIPWAELLKILAPSGGSNQPSESVLNVLSAKGIVLKAKPVEGKVRQLTILVEGKKCKILTFPIGKPAIESECPSAK